MMANYNKGGKNLNTIAHDSAIDLILTVRNTLGFKVKRIICDTVGTSETYQKNIRDALGGDESVEIVIESKPDDTYPIVGAASICAKVSRDHSIIEWEYVEKNMTFSRAHGCGYPGNTITCRWLVDTFDTVFGYPSIVRFSWLTASRIIEAK